MCLHVSIAQAQKDGGTIVPKSNQIGCVPPFQRAIKLTSPESLSSGEAEVGARWYSFFGGGGG
jgi:hypothetical protein